ncbi:MAG: hypothetical protein JSS98_19140 [Bacteroidetes bacterium]|nr:hypothetical protein [Bacteroidota bacterium]
MAIIDQLKGGTLSLGGKKPAIFGVNPTPPDSLHDTYSTTGDPNVTWRTINGSGMKPVPSNLDETKSKDVYKPSYKYLDHPPK